MNQVSQHTAPSMMMQFGETSRSPLVPCTPLPLPPPDLDFGHAPTAAKHQSFALMSPVSSEVESDAVSSWVSAQSQEWQLNPLEELSPCQPDMLSRRQACSSCGAMGATRGVPSSSTPATWLFLACRRCSEAYRSEASLNLAGRCVLCPKVASYGPAGTSRSDTLHCRRHKLPGEVSYAPNPARLAAQHQHQHQQREEERGGTLALSSQSSS
eukprot:3350085-Rhodomonas_salina.1